MLACARWSCFTNSKYPHTTDFWKTQRPKNVPPPPDGLTIRFDVHHALAPYVTPVGRGRCGRWLHRESVLSAAVRRSALLFFGAVHTHIFCLQLEKKEKAIAKSEAERKSANMETDALIHKIGTLTQTLEYQDRQLGQCQRRLEEGYVMDIEDAVGVCLQPRLKFDVRHLGHRVQGRLHR